MLTNRGFLGKALAMRIVGPRTIARMAATVACFFVSGVAAALDFSTIDWQLHGFASQGFTYTTSNQVFGASRGGSLDFTEIGVNGSVRLLPNLLFSAQGLYRNAGGSDREDFRLDFAQVDYNGTFLDSALTLGVRAGRVKIPFGLYNDTRDVVWTRPSVILPQSVYFDTLGLRQAMISADGGLLYSRYNWGDHRFNLEFMVAEPQDDTGDATDFLTGMLNSPGRMDGRPLFLGRAVYEWMGGRARAMFSVVDLDRDFRSRASGVPSGNIQALYPLFSLQYNAERWSLTAEYGWVDARRSGFTPVPIENTSEGFYVQGEYRLSDDWSAVLRYDVFHADRDDRSGRSLAEQTGQARHRFYAYDLAVGVRWEFVRNWLIAAEYHNVEGTAWLSPHDNSDLLRGGGDPHWDLFSVMVSFRF
ncbi:MULTISPECIES: porin [Methylocaldum]|jgi:hypothetical protein|uniref:porin n=1 Tax=unclassified Methylocaldum TaxID=2622260 RepID=UPI001061CFE9|nr:MULTISPECIES: porin [unclassified Methylocaldum]MBP1150946.1 hypothetical protein [Methylocaldum sp. RMAD-M]MDV3242505.1 porin [Methylocaldum sp.]MVF21615.1 porin [Methylocaldum sp. BRCS4]